MASISMTSFMTSILPSVTDGYSKEGSFEGVDREKQECVALLIHNWVEEAFKAFSSQKPKLFDGNPGDLGCQRQAWLTFRLMQNLELKKEFEKLKNTISDISNQKCKIFSIDISISREMKYMLHCRLLQIIRSPIHIDENGVIITVSDVGWLSKLQRRITNHTTKEFRQNIVQKSQHEASELAAKMMREEAAKISCLEDKVIHEVLSEKYSYRCARKEGCSSRVFMCLFYDMTAVMLRMYEEGGFFAFKSIEKKNKKVGLTPPFFIFFVPSTKGVDFECVSEESCKNFNSNRLMIVIETVFSCSKEEAIKKIDETGGFMHSIKCCVASYPQYWNDSKIEDVKHQSGRNRITEFAKKGEEVTRLISIDHLYCTTLGQETIQKTNLSIS